MQEFSLVHLSRRSIKRIDSWNVLQAVSNFFYSYIFFLASQFPFALYCTWDWPRIHDVRPHICFALDHIYLGLRTCLVWTTPTTDDGNSKSKQFDYFDVRILPALFFFNINSLGQLPYLIYHKLKRWFKQTDLMHAIKHYGPIIIVTNWSGPRNLQ